MLTESPTEILGASWGTDDQIIFGTARGGLMRVSGGGGEPEMLTTPDTAHGERGHLWPFVLPGREAVVFVISTGEPRADGQLAVLDLSTGRMARCVRCRSMPRRSRSPAIPFLWVRMSSSRTQARPTSASPIPGHWRMSLAVAGPTTRRWPWWVVTARSNPSRCLRAVSVAASVT